MTTTLDSLNSWQLDHFVRSTTVIGKLFSLLLIVLISGLDTETAAKTTPKWTKCCSYFWACYSAVDLTIVGLPSVFFFNQAVIDLTAKCLNVGLTTLNLQAMNHTEGLSTADITV